jgi:hypothetical protein
MAKKEAHDQALKMFIKSKGKTTLKAIAEAVGVNSLTVGRWYKKKDWNGKIDTIKAAPTTEKQKPVEGVVIRKKGLFDEAVKLFQESGRKISNVELGKQLNVSVTTITKWKKMPQWIQAAPTTVTRTPAPVVFPAQSAGVDIESITSLEDLAALNERLRSMLQRDFLTAAEIEHLSNAKLSLLEAAEVYLGIVKNTGD